MRLSSLTSPVKALLASLALTAFMACGVAVTPPVTITTVAPQVPAVKSLPKGAEQISFNDPAHAARLMRGADATSGPISASPATVDFGVVRPHSVVEGTIRLSNTSSQAIFIEKATPSCTCTTVDMVGKQIPAQGSIDMPMSMKTNDAIGAKVAKVDLVFRGIPTPLSVTYKAEVAFIVRASPPFVDMTTADLSGKIELDPAKLRGTYKVQADDRKPFRVLSVDNQPASIDGFDPAQDAPRSEYTINYDFTTTPDASIPRWIIVETDRDDCPLVDLRVRHPATRYVPTIPFEQFRAAAGATSPNAAGEFSILLKKFAGRVLAVQSGDARFKITETSQTSDESGILMRVGFSIDPTLRGSYLFPVKFTVQAPTATGAAPNSPVQGDLFVYGLVR